MHKSLALWQNDKLNQINKSLAEQQFKPMLALSNSSELDINKEKGYTYYRDLKMDSQSAIINLGFSQYTSYMPYILVKLTNLGLGPVVELETYMYKLVSVDGLNSLDEMFTTTTTIEGFYDRIHYENYEIDHLGELSKDDWLIFTTVGLGISGENNKLNLVFSCQYLKEPLHSIIEFRYKNILGASFKQYVYIGYDDEFESGKILPISSIYQ